MHALKIPAIHKMAALGALGVLLVVAIIGGIGFVAGFFVGLKEPRDLTIGENICANYDAKHGYGVKK